LRARRFNVQDAFEQYKDTEEWRAANQLETLYETIDLQHFEETRRLVRQNLLSVLTSYTLLHNILTAVS
jgi:hypothetical protein